MITIVESRTVMQSFSMFLAERWKSGTPLCDMKPRMPNGIRSSNNTSFNHALLDTASKDSHNLSVLRDKVSQSL